MHLEILVEEPSMEAALKNLLPGMLPEPTTFRLLNFQGKQNLLRQLPARLRGYTAWITDNYRRAYPRLPASLTTAPRFHNPDAIAGGTWEELERIFQRAGYFKGGYPKIEAARAISAHMDPTRNRSHSFRIFRDGLMALF